MHERLHFLRVDLFPELRGVLKALQRGHLSKRVAELGQVHQRIVRAVLLNGCLLHRSHLLQTHQTHLVRPATQSNVHHHVHRGIPAARINRYELVTQAHDLRLVLMLNDQLEEPLEALLQAVCEQAGDHLDAVLRGRQLRLHRRPRGGLQHVSIQTLRRAGDARALGLHLVQISHDAKSGLADERGGKRNHCARIARADDGSRLIVKHVVHVDLPFHHDGARMDGLGKAVQRVSHDRRLNQLQVHRLIGDRHAEDRMRRRIRLQNGERSRLHYFIMQNEGAIADRADLMQFGDAVAVLVHADIAFDVENLVRRLVCRLRDAEERLVSRVSDDDFIVHLEAASASVHLDVFALVTHRHKVGNGHKAAASDVDCVLNGHCLVVDEELFRRDTLDNVARRADRAPNGHADDLFAGHQVSFLSIRVNLYVFVLRD